MLLDQNSLLVAIGVAAGGLMLTLLVAWLGARKDKYLLTWGFGLALIVVSVLTYGLFSEPYEPALQFVAFELLVTGFALTHAGAVLFRTGAGMQTLLSASLPAALFGSASY